MTDLRVGHAEVRAAEVRAHMADEIADCAGLTLADAVLDGSADVELLARRYRAARVEATYAWAVLSDAIAQRTAVPA